MERRGDVERIVQALAEARRILERFTPGAVAHRRKAGGDPLTAADLAVNEALRSLLVQGEDGWLSEETADDAARLGRRRVWIVDPLDGTREFVQGLPEWCVSIALVEYGRPVAGGICNPAAEVTVVGAVGSGASLNGAPCAVRRRTELCGAEVLASRSETERGEWEPVRGAPFVVKPLGSVAYKLARVAAGLTDATWTLVPKHEWDVAAGTALVLAAGGAVWIPHGAGPRFNRERPLLPGLAACAAGLERPIREFLERAAR